MNTHTWTCAFCGKTETGINGPVEPANPGTQPVEDPPCTGWHRHEGSSYGMGFPEKAKMYCSTDHLIRKLQGEPPIAETTEIVIKGWRAMKPTRPDPRAPR